MKTIACISAATLMLSLAALESKGNWWVLTLATALVSLVVLGLACARLGYFGGGTLDGDEAVSHLPEKVYARLDSAHAVDRGDRAIINL
jgi:hypothetical protein